MSIDAKPWPGGGGAASVPDATETTAGKIRIATSGEAATGIDDTIAMTPLTVKERIDAAVTGGVEYKGTFNATAGTPSLLNAEKGDLYIIDTLGTIYGQTWAVGDHLLINEDMGGSITNSKIDKVDNTDAVTSVNTLTGPVVLSADDLEGDHAGVNYTGLATDTIDVHLSGIDSALGSVGGNQLVRADIKNTSFNADRNSVYRIGTDALTMTMPSSGLSEGDLIGVYAVSSNEFDLTVSGSLVTINASSVSSVTIKVNKRSIMLWVYDASTSRWVQTSDSLDTGSSSDAGIFKVATNAEAEAATIVDKVLVPGLMPYVDLSTLDNDLSADDFPADHLASNYTPANANIDGHLSGIDTALGLAGGLSAVEDDPAPRLGGPLTVNGQAITSASNGDVTINPDGTGDISIGADIIPDADATHTIGDENNRFITLHSELNGAVQFKARNETGGPLTKGQAVYISGVSGSVPLVSLARANSASTMPAHGLLAADVTNNADVQVVTFGNLTDYDTTTYSLSANDTVYVSSATAGALTNSAPTGEANLIQNIGRVVRADASAGIIKVGGAGRSAATPNLDSGKIFLGNGSNQAVSTALSAINLTSFNDDLGLATVATTGAYSDLSGTPTLATVATTGAYSDLSGTPTLGTAAALDVGTSASNVVQLDGSARLPAVDGSQLTNLPSGATQLNDLSDVTITGATTGEVLRYSGAAWVDATLAYSDLSGTPTLATVATTGAYSDLSGTPTLATVATTGAYSDLSGTPTLGTAAALDVGTSASNVVQLDGSARLPAVDGSQLTNLPSGASDLNGLSDVTISTPAGGNLLENNGSGQFVNVAKSTINVGDFNDDSTYQPLDAGLTSISGLTTSADKMIYTTASDTYAVADLTSAGRALLDDADATAQRTTLGLGTAATSNTGDFLASTATLNDISDVTITGVSNGQVISYNSTSGEWENSTPSSGGYSVSVDTTTIATSSPVNLSAPSDNEEVYIVSNAANNVTVNLVAAATCGAGFKYTFKILGTGAVTLDPNSTEYIDHSGQTTYVPAQYDSISIITDGSNWYLV